MKRIIGSLIVCTLLFGCTSDLEDDKTDKPGEVISDDTSYDAGISGFSDEEW